MTTVTVQDLPLEWFDRPQYRPRIATGNRDAWFVLSPAFAPPALVPEIAAREPPAGRAALRAAFDETYSTWSLPRSTAAELSLDAIAKPGTAVVVAGQQPGFLGGPLHTIYKAIGAIAAARKYRALTGRACVPIFWVAGDDHDFEEVRDAHLPGTGGEEAMFRFPGEADRRPLSAYPVDAAVVEVLIAAAKHVEGRRFGADACALIDLYRGRGLASGFAAMIERLLGHTGLLVLDPETVRPLAQRILRGAIEAPEKILELVEAGRAEVDAKGLKPLVAGRLPLFHIRDGKRHHLSPAPGGLAVDGGGPSLGRADAIRALEKNPRCFGPGALLRPIIQSECLPCVLSIGGPAEVGYVAQIGPLSGHFGFPRPEIALRFNATLVEGKLARAAQRVGLEAISRARSAEDLLAPEDAPAALTALHALRSQADAVLGEAVTRLAPQSDVERMRKRALEISSDIDGFADRLAKARAGLRTQELDEARRLWNFSFPAGALQERRWGVLHFIAKHGTGWLDEIIARIEDDPIRVVHRWITFEA